MDCLVQPFVPELASASGEWSLLFFRGRYSHAVLKRPQAGDFRVQEEFGGVADAAEPPPEVIVDGGSARWRRPATRRSTPGWTGSSGTAGWS